MAIWPNAQVTKQVPLKRLKLHRVGQLKNTNFFQRVSIRSL